MPAEGDAFSRELAVAQSAHESSLIRHDELIRSAAAELQAIQKQIADLDAIGLGRACHGRSGLDFEALRLLRKPPCRGGAGESGSSQLRTSEGQVKLRAERSVLERQQFVAQWETNGVQAR